MDELDGRWTVWRVGGLLPPLFGVRKRISGGRGITTLGPFRAPFDVVGRELRYRGLLTRGIVDALEPDGAAWRGVTFYRGRRLGRFGMRRLT